MGKITKEDLENRTRNKKAASTSWIKVGMSTCGIAAGADEVYAVLCDEVKKKNLPIEVKKCGCMGMCYAEPLVEVNLEGTPRVTYGRVSKDVALRIVEKHLCDKMLVNDYIYDL